MEPLAKTIEIWCRIPKRSQKYTQLFVTNLRFQRRITMMKHRKKYITNGSPEPIQPQEAAASLSRQKSALEISR